MNPSNSYMYIESREWRYKDKADAERAYEAQTEQVREEIEALGMRYRSGEFSIVDANRRNGTMREFAIDVPYDYRYSVSISGSRFSGWCVVRAVQSGSRG